MLSPRGVFRLSSLLPVVGALCALLCVVLGLIYFLSGTEEDLSALYESAPEVTEEIEEENADSLENAIELAEGDEPVLINTNAETARDNDRFDTALIAQDHMLCKKITNQQLEDKCWDEILHKQALRETSQRKCDLLRNENTKIRCTDHVLFEHIQERHTYDQCENLTSTIVKERCLQLDSREKMMAASTIEDCAGIQTESERTSCRDFFVAKIIQSQENPKAELCEILPEEGSKQQCLLQIAVKEAKSIRDVAPCHELTQKSSRILCLKSMQELLQYEEMTRYINEGNVEGCQVFSDKERLEECRNGALVIRAKNDGEPEYCGYITSESQKKLCLEKATEVFHIATYRDAKEQKRPELCNKIEDKNMQNACMNAAQS